jgi:hypothetical protein
MAGAPLSAVDRQVSRAGRRLFVQTLLDCLVWCWTTALVVSALWFLAQPWLLSNDIEAWVRWAVAGGIFAVASSVGWWRAWQTAPSRVSAALELDQRFKLKERVTSSLTLAPELLTTSAGLALAADADAHADKVDVRKGFPVRLSWTAVLVPLTAVLLALVTIFYNPVFNSPETVQARTKDEIKVVAAKLIEEKFNNLKKPTTFQWPADQPKDEKLEEIAKLREELFKEPFDPNNKDRVRERLQQLLPLEDKIKDRMDELKAQQDRNKAQQQKLKDMGKDPNQQLGQDGPGQGVDDALNKGDLDKAQREMKALADKLKDEKLNDKEREQLQNQLAEMKEKLENVADQKELKEKLEKDLKDGKIDKQQFDKQMAQAKEQADKMKDLKELSDKIGEGKDALDKGDQKGAAEKLGQAADKMKKMDPNNEEMQRLQQEQQRLQELRDAMNNGLGNQPNVPPGGLRPFAKDGKHDFKDEKQKGELNIDTQFRVDGMQKGGTFNKIPSSQVGGVFRQARQDAPEAIERQQVPTEYADFLRGYYENLGGGQKK